MKIQFARNLVAITWLALISSPVVAQEMRFPSPVSTSTTVVTNPVPQPTVEFTLTPVLDPRVVSTSLPTPTAADVSGEECPLRDDSPFTPPTFDYSPFEESTIFVYTAHDSADRGCALVMRNQTAIEALETPDPELVSYLSSHSSEWNMYCSELVSVPFEQAYGYVGEFDFLEFLQSLDSLALNIPLVRPLLLGNAGQSTTKNDSLVLSCRDRSARATVQFGSLGGFFKWLFKGKGGAAAGDDAGKLTAKAALKNADDAVKEGKAIAGSPGLAAKALDSAASGTAGGKKAIADAARARAKAVQEALDRIDQACARLNKYADTFDPVSMMQKEAKAAFDALPKEVQENLIREIKAANKALVTKTCQELRNNPRYLADPDNMTICGQENSLLVPVGKNGLVKVWYVDFGMDRGIIYLIKKIAVVR